MYTDPGSSIYTKTDAYFLQTYLAKSITIWAFFHGGTGDGNDGGKGDGDDGGTGTTESQEEEGIGLKKAEDGAFMYFARLAMCLVLFVWSIKAVMPRELMPISLRQALQNPFPFALFFSHGFSCSF